jgi:hypothetical protein
MWRRGLMVDGAKRTLRKYEPGDHLGLDHPLQG